MTSAQIRCGLYAGSDRVGSDRARARCYNDAVLQGADPGRWYVGEEINVRSRPANTGHGVFKLRSLSRHSPAA